ncbi:MAG: hypothetical protein AB7N65_17675 [Vicinamibacterales bacterium]
MADRKFPTFPDDPPQAQTEAEAVLEEVADSVDAVPEDQPTDHVAGAAATADHYTIGSWGGIEKYECIQPGCPFDSLNKGRVEEHWRKVHAPPPPPRPSTGLVALDGSPLF